MDQRQPAVQEAGDDDRHSLLSTDEHNVKSLKPAAPRHKGSARQSNPQPQTQTPQPSTPYPSPPQAELCRGLALTQSIVDARGANLAEALDRLLSPFNFFDRYTHYIMVAGT